MNIFAGKKISFDVKYFHVELEEGRIISTPLKWYPELGKATFKQLKKYKFICQKTGIEWPELDCHLSIEAMILGKTQNIIHAASRN